MDERFLAVPVSDNLADRVARSLGPVFEECFSEETRKVANYLLLISTLLILSSIGLVDIAMKPFPVESIGLEATVRIGVPLVLLLLCFYFEVVFLARSSIESRYWRLKQQGPFVDFNIARIETLANAIDGEKPKIEILHRIAAASDELNNLQADTSGQSALNAELEMLNDKLNTYKGEVGSRNQELQALNSDRFTSAEGERIRAALNESCEAFEQVNHAINQLHRRKDEYEKQIALKRDAVNCRLSEAMDELKRITSSAANAQNRLNFLVKSTQNLRWIVLWRLQFERLLPLTAGIVAMVFGIYAVCKG